MDYSTWFSFDFFVLFHLSTGEWWELERGSATTLLFGASSSEEESCSRSRWGNCICRHSYWCPYSTNSPWRIWLMHRHQHCPPHPKCHGLWQGCCPWERYGAFCSDLLFRFIFWKAKSTESNWYSELQLE